MDRSTFLNDCANLRIYGKLEYQQRVIAELFHPKLLVSFPRIALPETIKLRIRSFFHARNNSCT